MRVYLTKINGPREMYIIPESREDRDLLDKLFCAGYTATVEDQSFFPRKAGYQRYGIKIETVGPGVPYERQQAILPPPPIRAEVRYYCVKCNAVVGLGQPSCRDCKAVLR